MYPASEDAQFIEQEYIRKVERGMRATLAKFRKVLQAMNDRPDHLVSQIDWNILNFAADTAPKEVEAKLGEACRYMSRRLDVR